MDIVHYIGKLLFEHNCVIVPDFGGFVAEYKSAQIHPTQHIFNPPSKSIAFNKNLKNNDGLLANFIAKNENITFENAETHIKQFVSYCKSELQNDNKVTLKNIGQFSFDVERNLQFVPETSVNYLLDTFGLASFQFPAIKRDTISEKIERKIKNDRPSIPLSKAKKRTFKLKYIALAIIPLIITAAGILVYNSNFSNNSSFQYSNVNLIPDHSSNITPNPASTEIATTPDISDSETAPTGEIALEENIQEEAVSKADTEILAPKKQDPPKPKNVKPIKKKGRYHIIGGAFAHFPNAKKLVERLKSKGFDAEIVDVTKGGLHRVSFGSCQSRQEAKNELSKIKTNHQNDAWLLTKSI